MGGAAIVIGLQQLKGLLGLSHFTNSTDVVSVVKAVCSALHDPVSVRRRLCLCLSRPPKCWAYFFLFVNKYNKKSTMYPDACPTLIKRESEAQ